MCLCIATILTKSITSEAQNPTTPATVGAPSTETAKVVNTGGVAKLNVPQSEYIDSAPPITSQIQPIVNLEKQNGKKLLDVHVPIFFDMVHAKENGRSSLDLSVLKGLVSVSRERKNLLTPGPLSVSILGIPIYNSPGLG